MALKEGAPPRTAPDCAADEAFQRQATLGPGTARTPGLGTPELAPRQLDNWVT